MAEKKNREEKIESLVNTPKGQDPWDAYFNANNQAASTPGKKKKKKKKKNVFLAPSVMMSIICGLAIIISLIALGTTAFRIARAEATPTPEIIADGEPTPSPTPFPSPVPIQGVESFLTLSDELCTLTKTDEEWCKKEEDPSDQGLYFISKELRETLIYQVDANSLCKGEYSLTDFNYMWINSENNGFNVVINIAGSKIDLSDYYILVRDEQGLYASRVIINCYEADEVILSNAIVTGTILAPKATIKCGNAFVYGQLIGKNYEGNLRFKRDIVFTGYADVMGTTHGVDFTNTAIKKRVIEALKKADSRTYGSYGMGSELLEKDIKRIFELDLSDLEIKDFAHDLDLFSHLLSLDISGNAITDFDLSNFPNLQALYVRGLPIKELDISPCTALRILDVSSTRLNSLPDFSKAPKLEYLNIEDTDIKTLDCWSLQNLKKLNISNNSQLYEFDVSKLELIEQLDISYCSLTSLSLQGAKNLVYLKASGNSYESISLDDAPKLAYAEVYTESLKTIMAKDFLKRTNSRLYRLESATVVNS